MRETIEWEEDWQQHAILLIRHAKACAILQDEPACYLSIFRLCWHHSEEVAKVFTGNITAGLKQQWQLFQDNYDLLDNQYFPAWFLIKHPSLANSLPEHIENEAGQAYQSYQIVYALQQHQQQKNEKEILQLRKQLQKLTPEVFSIYLQNT